MDFAGEVTYEGFWYSWSNSGQIARRRWYESPEGNFLLRVFLAYYKYSYFFIFSFFMLPMLSVGQSC